MDISDVCRICNDVSGIYQIECLETGKIYLGRSDTIGIRVMGHFYLLRNGTHYNKNLQSDFNLYKEDSFRFSIVEECDASMLKEVEGRLIRSKDKSMLYNKHMSENTGAVSGKITDETRKKQSDRQKGEKNHFFGKKHSPEAKEKIRQSKLNPKKGKK